MMEHILNTFPKLKVCASHGAWPMTLDYLRLALAWPHFSYRKGDRNCQTKWSPATTHWLHPDNHGYLHGPCNTIYMEAGQRISPVPTDIDDERLLIWWLIFSISRRCPSVAICLNIEASLIFLYGGECGIVAAITSVLGPTLNHLNVVVYCAFVVIFITLNIPTMSLCRYMS